MALGKTASRKVMLLAAGRGERLRPLTDSVPKPLVEVAGISLLEHHLKKIPHTQVVINHAWLGKSIEEKLHDGTAYELDIQYSAEPEGGLETGGGILQALPLLTDGDTPFVVINGDVFTDYDIHQLVVRPWESGCLAHLVLVPTPSFKTQGDFGLDAGRVLAQGEWTFSGMSILHPDLFKGMTPGRFPLAPLLRDAMRKGLVTGEIFTGFWSDIGTLERLEAARQQFRG